MSENREIVERLLRATARADVDEALELCAEDFVYLTFETFRGRDGLREFLEFQSSLGAVDREITRIVVEGDSVAVERKDTFVTEKGAITMPTAGFFTVSRGLVRRWADYQDRRDAMTFVDY